MDTKFTPGPWSQDKYGNILDAHGETVVATGISISTGYCANETPKYNARLITAEPSMLEALRITRGNVASLGPAGALEPHYEYREWLRMLDEVIAKATGEK